MSTISPQTRDQPLPSSDALLAAHGRICDEYGRLEQLRSTQLASVPAATALLGGASIFLGTAPKPTMFTNFVLALGLLGMFTTFGLYFREEEMEVESDDVASQGRSYEDLLKIPGTIFTPSNKHKVFNKKNASILIYASSFTAWFCVATWFVLPGLAIILAPFVLLVIGGVQWLLREARLSLSPQMPQLRQQT
jgi:hypothetical protein